MSTTKYVPQDLVLAIEEAMPHLTAGVWRLCAETGIRVSDACKARCSDFDGNKFTYVAQKTGKKGVATVSSDFIRRYVCGRGKQYVFPSPYKLGKHVTRQTVFNHVKLACDRLQIDADGVAPHSARKHFAVELFHNKGLGATMQALQHRDAGTTMIYALSDDALHKLIVRVRRLERLVDGIIDELHGDDRLEITDTGKHAINSLKSYK